MENKGNNKSTFILLIITLFIALLCLIRIISLAAINTPSYTDPVVSRRNIRGTIYDRRGNALAFDTSSTGFLFAENSRVQEASSFIFHYTDLSALEITAMVESGTRFIPSSVSNSLSLKEIEKKIEKAGLGESVAVARGYYRSSPYVFLDFLLGRSISSYSATGGIEEKYNSYLKAVPTLGEKTERGEDIVLTLDIELERILLEALEKEDRGLRAAILNSKGEILAWRGEVTEALLSQITYSHSNESETVLFEREAYITNDETSPLSSFSIYLSSEENDALSLIENALKKNGRI